MEAERKRRYAYKYRDGLTEYPTLSDIQAKAAAEIADLVRRSCSPAPSSLLDVGTGNGALLGLITQALNAMPGRLMLVEPDHELRRHAVQTLSCLTGRPVAARLYLDRVRGEFDVILASHVLYYIKDLTGFGDDIDRLLTRGGALIITVRSLDCASHILREIVRRHRGERARISPALIGNEFRPRGYTFFLSTISSRLTFPAGQIDALDLALRGRLECPNPLVRFVYWMGRLTNGERISDPLREELLSYVRSLTTGDSLELRMSEDIIALERRGCAD